MSKERKQVLEMLKDGKITVDEAERLLSAVDQPDQVESNGPGNVFRASGDDSGGSESTRRLKFLRVTVEPNSEMDAGGGDDDEDRERVNVKIPLSLIRAGMKFTALIPNSVATQVNDSLHQQGIDIDLNRIKPEDFNELVDALADLEIDVQEARQRVRVFVE